jgi:hypothetical protein
MQPTDLASAAAAVEIVMAAALAVLAVLAWRRAGGRRLAILPVAFLLLLGQAVLLALALLGHLLDLTTAVAWGAVLNSAALVAMYLALLRP